MQEQKLEQTEALEKHHPDRNNHPNLTVQISLEQHHHIHGTEPIRSELTTLMRRYDKIVQLSVMIQNWNKAFKKEFPEDKFELDQTNINIEKKTIIKEAEKLIHQEQKMIKIKGIGTIFLARFLAFAHPNRFSNKTKFLNYCGYTQASIAGHKYSRKAHSLGWQIIKSLILQKEERFYPIYKQWKEQIASNHPEYPKHKIDGISRNRTATILYKELYQTFRSRKGN
jgi:hypothetical protein